ncbi:MAG TPA: helical backbone metal receptor [Hanamia sp.]|nr:helical backbone metal receptor [Hanamia sp.]
MILSQAIPGKKYFRIISLVPSLTELLSYLDLEKEVIGITKFCVHPYEWFQNKTRVGGTKNINFKTIQQLSPDLIIANKEENVKEQIEKLAEKYDVWITDVNNLSDSIKMIYDIGKLIERTESATALALQIDEGFKKLQMDFLKPHRFSKPVRFSNAAYFIWKDPYMVAGGDTFINDMMHYCGLKNVFENQKRYPQITLDELQEKNTEVILLSSEPYPFKEKHKEQIQKQMEKTKIELVDGEMFSWYGSRMLKSINYFHKFQQNV